MIKTLLIILTIVLLTTSSIAQETSDTTMQKAHKNAFFVEFLGANGYSSLNYDREVLKINKFSFRTGFGVGYANYGDFTPNIASYVLRLDMLFSKKIIKPVIGYAFSDNLDLDDAKRDYYLVHSPNIGVDIKINRFDIIPKYYLMLVDRSDYDNLITVHWLGLQIRFNF